MLRVNELHPKAMHLLWKEAVMDKMTDAERATPSFRPDWRSHPGETLSDILGDSYWKPLPRKSIWRMLGVNEQYLSDFLEGRTGVTPEFAERLAGVFGPSAEFWLRLQALYDAPAGADLNAVMRYWRGPKEGVKA